MSAIVSAARVVPRAKAVVVAVIACVLGAALGLGAGAWLGSEWQQGRRAQTDNVLLVESAKQLAHQAAELRQRALDVVQDFRTAQRRVESIVEGNDHDRLAIESLFEQQRQQTEEWLATRLDLYDCRIGPAGMHAWNAAAAPGRAVAAATEHAAGAAPIVPGGAVTADGGPRPGADTQPREGREAVPRVPLQQGSSDRGNDRL